MERSCEVCLNPLNGPLLDLGSHPLCDDLLKVGSTDQNNFYRQSIALCEICLTALQLYPVPKLELFKPSYHYRARLTADVLDGMDRLVESVADLIRLDSRSTVLDIGCNDGSLLNKFKLKFGCQTIGLDPTDAIKDAPDSIDNKIQAYFDSDSVSLIRSLSSNIDVITFTNVFAHIEDLQTLCKDLRSILSKNTIVVIENHYLGSILATNQFDTFYHEHPRTYSLRSFVFIAQLLDLALLRVEFPTRYGGNIRVIMGAKGQSVPDVELRLALEKESEFCQQYSALQKNFDGWKVTSRILIEQLIARHGKIVGKALPGRAVMLINSLALSDKQMPFVLEKSESPKVGNYVPGTRIEVVSDKILQVEKPPIIIVWAWHIVDEIVTQLDSLGFHGEIWVPLPSFKRIR